MIDECVYTQLNFNYFCGKHPNKCLILPKIKKYQPITKTLTLLSDLKNIVCTEIRISF